MLAATNQLIIRNLMEPSKVLLADVREETRNLLRASNYIIQGTTVLACQRKCLSFASPKVS